MVWILNQARELYVLSQLDVFVAQVAEQVRGVEIASIQVVDGGDGESFAAATASYPTAVVRVLGTLKSLTGVDITGMLSGKENA